MKNVIPSGPEVARSALVTLGGILIAAWVISRFPNVRAFVQQNSLTVKDPNGATLYY